MSLFKHSKPVFDLTTSTTLVYGPPGVGKSSFASQFPDCVFLATEKGYDHLDVTVADIVSWKDFLNALQEITKMQKKPKTIVIDIIDHLYTYCEDFICEANEVKKISEVPGWGEGHKALKKNFVQTFNKIAKLGFGVVLISHAKQKEIEIQNTKKMMWDTSLGGTAATLISGMSGYIFRAYIGLDNKRMIQTQADHNAVAKSRIPFGETQLLPRHMPMDFQLVQDYLTGKKTNKPKEKRND